MEMSTKLCLAIIVTILGADVGASLHATPRPLDTSLSEDAKLRTPELGAKYGYPVETHTVTTADGYILSVHRIPHGRKVTPPPPEGRPVMWLQHGVLCTSSDWLMNTQEKALAYRLADSGYDVWLGNARGNTYSKAHVSLDVRSDEFWDFTWHEMGLYDLPAVFDYVLNHTGQRDLYYTGHSMGTTMFFTCMATRPEYNSKVRLMSAFAPVAFTEHMISPIRVMSPYANNIEGILHTLGLNEFLPSTAMLELLGATICATKNPLEFLCKNVVFLICGYDSEQLNATMLPIILGHTPGGSSARAVAHYAQGVNSGLFRQYDRGTVGNLERYGQEEPPVYNVSKITAPIALYWGENDWLGDKTDVHRIAKLLPNIQRNYRVPDDRFNHMDFLYAIDALSLVYKTYEAFLKKF